MRLSTLASIAMMLFTPGVALSAEYGDPTILTVEGRTEASSEIYTVEQLRSDFVNMEIETRTPWTEDGEQIRYRGPRIIDVLRKHRLAGSTSVQFVAYDSFISEIMVAEIETYDPIFAIDRACQDRDRESGRCAADQEFTPLTLEEQGPIFLVWHYDRLPTAYVPARNSIWVWFVIAMRPVP